MICRLRYLYSRYQATPSTHEKPDENLTRPCLAWLRWRYSTSLGLSRPEVLHEGAAWDLTLRYRPLPATYFFSPPRTEYIAEGVDVDGAGGGTR